MKLWLKLLSLFFVLAFTLSVFVGCNGANTNDPSDTDYEDETDDDEIDYFPEIDKKDYNDELNLYVATENERDFYVLDESNGSPMDEAVFSRMERIKRYLGIDGRKHCWMPRPMSGRSACASWRRTCLSRRMM